MATQNAAAAAAPGPHVRVWCADVEARSATELAADLELLDSREHEQAQRFYFEADRRAYITAHALVRRALSATARDDFSRTIEPRDWTYRTGSHGRPDVAGPASAPPLRFNLSHCRGMVTCAVATALDIGIDIEDTRRNAPLEIADHYFAATEVAALRSLPAAEQPERFFVYWTLKESYIKARGLGLSLPLAEFAFSIPGPGPGVAGADQEGPRVTLSAALLREDSPERWWFASWKVRNRFQLALAVASLGSPVRISHAPF